MKNKEKKRNKIIDQALMEEMGIDKVALSKLKKKLEKAEKKPERGIETWFRLASKNLYTRLQIVDTKANILITANAIIISVVLGSFYPRLDDDYHLIFGVGGMIITNIISISFAILATIPKSVSTSYLEGGHIDLMTFDHFSSLSSHEYEQKVKETLETGDALYSSIINDIHNLGLMLSKKYRLIRTSYLSFLYGIILSVFIFGMCHLLF